MPVRPLGALEGIGLQYRHFGSVKTVRSLDGLEVLLYCTGTEDLYRP